MASFDNYIEYLDKYNRSCTNDHCPYSKYEHQHEHNKFDGFDNVYFFCTVHLDYDSCTFDGVAPILRPTSNNQPPS